MKRKMSLMGILKIVGVLIIGAIFSVKILDLTKKVPVVGDVVDKAKNIT